MTTATVKKKENGALAAQTRAKSGKGSARALRREGRVPAVVYSQGKEPQWLSVPAKELALEYQRGRFISRVISLTVDGKDVRVLPREVQTHPVTDQIEHVDFLRVDDQQQIRVQVPVRFLGAEKCIGIKRGGVLNVVRHTVEMFCSPTAIPAFLEATITELDIGSSVHINDIVLPKGVATVIKNRNFTIATIAGRSTQMEEEAKPTPETVVEGEVPAEGAEGAAAEGEAKGKDEAKGKKKE